MDGSKPMQIWSLTTDSGDGPRIFVAEDDIDVANDVARKWLLKITEMPEADFHERYEEGNTVHWYNVEPLFGHGIIDVEDMNEEYRVVLHVAKI
jgi:hypothetical protein